MSKFYDHDIHRTEARAALNTRESFQIRAILDHLKKVLSALKKKRRR
jgi:hypothetical protein